MLGNKKAANKRDVELSSCKARKDVNEDADQII